MSQIDFENTTEVSIRLLDKTYQFRCPANEQESLLKAAKYLDNELRRTRSGGVVGLERLCLMTALNVTGDYLQLAEEKEHNTQQFREKLHQLQRRIDEALTSAEQLELE